MVEQLR